MCLVTENHLTRNSAEFIVLEQIVLSTFSDCNIEICCNDIQDISLVLQRLVQQEQDTLEVTETPDHSNIEAKEDENNNEKEQPSFDDFVQEDIIEYTPLFDPVPNND